MNDFDKFKQLMEEHNKLLVLPDDEWTESVANRFRWLNQKISDFPLESMSLTQDELVEALKLMQEGSYDIPSALMALCGHLDEDEWYWMHRPAMFGGDWEPADKHFLEVHGYDLKDKRINWSFDT